MDRTVRSILVLLAAAALICGSALAWDVEHDEVAQLTADNLPAEVRAVLTFADYGIILANCHYPDMIEWPIGGVKRYRNLDELAEKVGPRDREIFRSYGYTGSGWLHTLDGKALLMGLLARAFAAGEHAHAAFYIGALTHTFADESALNHPPILQFVQYSRLPGIDYRKRKVEESSKNVFGFRSDGYIVHRAREKLRGFRPSTPCDDFASCVDYFAVNVVRQADYAAQREVKIGYGARSEAEEALSDLVAMQVRSLVNIVWTAWKFRSPDAKLPEKGFAERIGARHDEILRTLDPAKQGVFAGVFDGSLDPSRPAGVVGVVCEPYGAFSRSETPYVGRMLGAMCARSARRLGYAVRGLRYHDVSEAGLPAPKDVPTVIAFTAGSKYMCREVNDGFAAAVKAYRAAGGRLILVGGSDAKDLSGFASAMTVRPNGEVPVSAAWWRAGVGEPLKMSVTFGGVRTPLFRDPNYDGFCKPVCSVTLADDAGLEPLATLDNGSVTRLIAARKGNVAWVPSYLLMPFLFVKDDPKLDFAALTLDPFGENVLKTLLTGGALP